MAGNLRRLALVLAGATLAGPAAAQGSEWGPVWTHESGTEGWIGRTVAVGDRGGQVLSQFGLGNDFTRLFSSTDFDPPTPVWEKSEGHTTYAHRVASADIVDVHVTLHDERIDLLTRRLVLRKFTSRSSVPDWSVVLPVSTNGHDAFHLAITPDGQRIVAVVHNIWNGREEMLVYGPDSATPVSTASISLLGAMRTVDLSASGNKLYIASDVRAAIVDCATGNTEFQKTFFEPVFDAHAISGDGDIFAYGTYNTVRVFVRNANGSYDQQLTHTIAGTWYSQSIDISSDGSTLACSFTEYSSFRSVRVQLLDLTASLGAGQSVVTSSDEVTGQGQYGNNVTGMELSADGGVLAVGLWGDELGSAPEVLVYHRGVDAPVYSYDLPGSVQALDLSEDGLTLGVASKAAHNNVTTGGGRLDLFDLSVGDLVARGVPRRGQSVRFEMKGTPGSPASLLTSLVPAASATDHGLFGTLWLDREHIVPVSMSDADATGLSSVDFLIPANAPVGQSIYFQGLAEDPRELTEDWVRVTVLP